MEVLLSLLPTIISVILTVMTRQALLSLMGGILLGSIILSKSLTLGFIIASNSIVEVFLTSWFIKNIIFLFLIGALLKVIERSGGVQGFIYILTKKTNIIKSGKGSLFLAYLAGIGMFLEGIGSMMTAGMVGRPLISKYKQPREKLAFICNSTGAPIAFLFPFGSAAAFIMGILGSQVESGVLVGSPISYILKAIPFQFYTLLILLAVPTFIFIIKDFGPMKKVFYREEYLEDYLNDLEERKEKVGRIDFMISPLMCLVFSIVGIIIYTGNGNIANGDTTMGIYLGSIFTTIFTGFYIVTTSSIKLDEYIKWCQEGMKDTLPSVIVLILASALGSIMGQLGTGEVISNLFLGNINPPLIPIGVFLICCVISFSTGSSGATIMIMLPLIIPMIVSAGISVPLILGAVISGAIFGDQSSPISDSIIVAAMAAGCEATEHFRTQLPYTLSVAGISSILFIISGFIFI